MSLTLDIQKLEVGSRVRLIEVDATEFSGDIYRFHNYNVEYTQAELLSAQQSGADLPPKSIIWQGLEYQCWPYQLEGIELDGTGATPNPSLAIANIDRSISALCLALNDLVQAKVTIHITMEHYLDGRPDADPTQEFTQEWYVDAKMSEDEGVITFALACPADISGKLIPARQVHSICHWMLMGRYRGPECGYTGTAYFTDMDVPTTDPSLDSCAGLCKSCKLRFGETAELPHGGFVGSTLR